VSQVRKISKLSDLPLRALIVTDHSEYDYKRIVRESQLVVDTRNATKGIDSPKIVRC